MKQVIGHFGRTILTVIIASCVMLLLSGMKGAMEEYLGESLLGKECVLGENEAFKQVKTTLKWQLSIKEDIDVRTGIAYEVEDFLSLIAPEGQAYKVRFVKGYQVGNPQEHMIITDEGRRVLCKKPGVYEVIISADSSMTGHYEMPIRLLVNGEEKE